MTEPPTELPRIVLDIDADGVATLRLNRPEVLNAFDDAMREQLVTMLAEIERNDAIRAVVVTGTGRGFCAGGDIRGMESRLNASAGEVALTGWRRQQRTHRALTALHTLGKPTIAAVNGPAAGLGCDLALCCDFIVASETASFAMSYILRGLIPDGGGCYFLPRRVGLARAKELIFSGRRVAPDEALAIGMVDRVTPPETLVTAAQAWARELARQSPAALALAKTMLNQTFEMTVDQAFDLGSQAQAICYTTREHRDSVEAFLAAAKAKRPGK